MSGTSFLLVEGSTHMAHKQQRVDTNIADGCDALNLGMAADSLWLFLFVVFGLGFDLVVEADSDAVYTEWEVESDDESEEESECGSTTLVDMPLNSFPSTVSKETFELKIKAAAKRIYVDVGKKYGLSIVMWMLGEVLPWVLYL
ncbi:Allantoinase [Camellia lanceoleosa]|nr:Allantoinase [Camellia lanceoleosa]